MYAIVYAIGTDIQYSPSITYTSYHIIQKLYLAVIDNIYIIYAIHLSLFFCLTNIYSVIDFYSGKLAI
jgi:hypothetical protein